MHRVEAGWVSRRIEEAEVPVVNVLSADEFAAGHVPGSVNVPLDDPGFERKVAELAPERAAPLVVYCKSLDCQASTKAAGRLEAAGYRNVYDFKAGMDGWRKAGFAVEAGAGRIPAWAHHGAVGEHGTEVSG